MLEGAGIGLRGPHYRAVLETRPAVGWLEVHAENHFGRGGPGWRTLEQLRPDYPLSVHGVGLSLGSSDPLDESHLRELAALVAHLEPALVSEHLSWTSVDARHFHGLLPLPYTEETLVHVARRVETVQERLGRPLLVENVARYLDFAESTLAEGQFLSDLARRTGCGVLLDLTNLYVTAVNNDLDLEAALGAMPRDAVQEIHLAGFAEHDLGDARAMIDTHDRPVPGVVWALYERALSRLGPVPTLIEWDAQLPALGELVAESERARRLLEHVTAPA